MDLVKKIQDLSKVHCFNGITFISSEQNEKYVSYQDLYHRALAVLHDLQAQGMKPKQELVFQIEDNETFIYVFWACILGGIILFL
ncbi:hypothetical protein [Caldalkalibacillus mannanilyticus]|uniref:hypothetical protein n=1 Tax=Caldalkalibacillus mannanilyticus TaxID=1418 RepID=UPI000687E93B|nr:hypothetical protein [Caldalkalibacillus mannanilyticus]